MDDPGSSSPDGHDASDNPPPKSYANVAGSSSSQINLSFDPKNIIPTGTLENEEGQKVLRFSSSETDRLDAAWRLTLIGKFSFAIPQALTIANGLSSLGIKGLFLGVLPINPTSSSNFSWKKTTIVFGWGRLGSSGAVQCVYSNGRLLLILKWKHPWRLFGSNFQVLGSPLQVDPPTARKTRLAFARVCIELNLEKERTEEIILKFGDIRHTQKIIYERVPPYCNFCKHIGHSLEDCYMNGNKAKPPPPVRRPATQGGSEGPILKGQTGESEKLRGPRVNSKKFGNPNSNPNGNSNHGGKQVVTNNPAWIMVNKKGAKETE
ncbi:hypothetical protein DH2020_014510 [Rehmannia glutinosa]|uniref:DUF4283 domain-containing protein n=1 Tax=Rehmannia glutinosa TaxID=99300 RepID=A0ABR0X0J5_REHGL